MRTWSLILVMITWLQSSQRLTTALIHHLRARSACLATEHQLFPSLRSFHCLHSTEYPHGPNQFHDEQTHVHTPRAAIPVSERDERRSVGLESLPILSLSTGRMCVCHQCQFQPFVGRYVGCVSLFRFHRMPPWSENIVNFFVNTRSTLACVRETQRSRHPDCARQFVGHLICQQVCTAESVAMSWVESESRANTP